MPGANTILYFTHTPTLYGANRSLLNLIDGLKAIDAALKVVVIIPEKGNIEAELINRNIEYYIIPFYWEVSSLNSKPLTFLKNIIKSGINIFLVLKYYSLLKKINPDCIHSNSSVISFGAYAAFVLKKPHVWHLREFGKEDYQLKFNFGKKYFYFWLRKAGAIIAVSRSIYNQYKLQGFLNAYVIYNGVISIKNIDQNKPDRPSQSAFIFLMAGIIAPQKNQLQGVMAVHQLVQKQYDIKLRIIGSIEDEAYGEKLVQYIEENNLENKIILDGFVNDMSAAYKKADCLLMCSIMEAMGRVTIEAMSFELPVIGYDAGGTSELIEDNVNGYLYNSTQKLCQKMEQIINDRTLSTAMGIRAKEMVKEKFTIEIYARKCYEIYQQLINH